MLIKIGKEAKEAQEEMAWKDALYKMATDKWAEEKIKYARKRRIELGRANMGKAGYVEGLGQLVAEYDAEMWWLARFTDRYHWDDPANRKRYQQDNPEVIVTK
jgi:hypothetical protein